MPVYTYRRDDGTTFEVKQKFTDDPLQVDPESGQKVTRLIQSMGVIFKGSGFYVNDSKGAKNSAAPNTKSDSKSENPAPRADSAPSAPAPSAPASSAPVGD